MGEERTRILRMVAEGTIDVDQADQLLETLGEDVQAEPDTGAPDEDPLANWVTAVPRARARIPRIKLGDLRARRAFDFDHIIQLAALGISPGYIKKLKKQNPDLTFDQALQVGLIGIDPSRFSELKAALGRRDLSFEQIVKMAALGVSPEYLNEMEKEWAAEEAEETHEEDSE